MANKWVDLGNVWSGRDLDEGERVTVSVFDKVTQEVLEQTTFVGKADRLLQMDWVMDLCEQVNAKLTLIRAGVMVSDKLEIQATGYLNKFWGITERDVQVITTTARYENWINEKRVHIDISEEVVAGATLNLTVHNSKGKLLETVSHKVVHGRSTHGLCALDFATEINRSSLYTRAGIRTQSQLRPSSQSLSNWLFYPFNADFTVKWWIDLSSLKLLDKVWSGRDLTEGEEVTVNVFDKATQRVMEQMVFSPKADRLGQLDWVMDLCAQVNAQLTLVRAGVKVDSKLEIQASADLNKFWSITDRNVMVTTTTAHSSNWTKQVNLDVGDHIVAGATLRLNIENLKGELLEAISFKPLHGRNTRGWCGKDFASHINQMSNFVRAGIKDGSLIYPSANYSNFVWLPFNANFTASWTVDLSSLKLLDKVWSGRDLTEGEEVTVNVFDKVTQRVMEQMVFSPKADRLGQLDWVMDLCKQVNAELTLVRAGVKVDSKLEIQASADLNKFWSITDRNVMVTTTTAHSSNWTKQVNLDVGDHIVAGATLRLNIENLKGELLESISFKPLQGRNTRWWCGKDFAIHINQMSNFVRAGVKDGSLIYPSATYSNFVWLPFNANFTASWSVDLSSLKLLDKVWSGRNLAEGERVTVNVFDKVTQDVLEQTTFVPKTDRLGQLDWVMDLCKQVNAELTLVRAGVKVDSKLEIQASGDLNKYWSITERDVLVVTTTARYENWVAAKRVHIDLSEEVMPGATLNLSVHNSKGKLLETVRSTVAHGRSAPGLCALDFATLINHTSCFVRAGIRTGNEIKPSAQLLSNWILYPFNADFAVKWWIDLPPLRDLGSVWSGRDLDPGERVTVNVFDKTTQDVLEQTTFVPKAGRLDQYTWVMDLCEQVNAQLKLVRAGVKADKKLEIQASGYLNKFWGITDRDVQVITTTARYENWINEKRVHIDLSEEVVAGATLNLTVHNSKGKLLETVSSKVAPGRSSHGLCALDFATQINSKSLYARAGIRTQSQLRPSAQSLSNWIFYPFNADFTVKWSIDLSSLKLLDEVWSGRDLVAGERITVNVFDRTSWEVLEQITFVPKQGRLDQYTWVMDLCEQVNAQLELVRAGIKVDSKLEIQATGYLNKFWNISDRDVQVITTTARTNNWPAEKRVALDLAEEIVPGATLHFKVHNSKGVLLETVSFKVALGRNAPGPCGQDFASEINRKSHFVRAGVKNGSNIQPSAQAQANGIMIPFNADFKVSWSIDLSSLIEVGELWSGRGLAEGERVTVNVFDKATQTVLEQTTFVPKAGRLGQYTWVMDLCAQVNAQLKMIRAGVPAGNKLEIPGSCYLNKFWNITDREVQVIITTASDRNWTTDKRLNIDLTQEVLLGATLQLKVHNAKGVLLETVSFKPTAGRTTPGLCSQDFASEINRKSHFVRAGVQSGSSIQPSATALANWIWIPFNADLKVSWSIDHSTGDTDHEDGWSIDLVGSLTEIGEVSSSCDLAEGERVTISVFDKALHVLLEQTTFVPKPGHNGQHVWLMEMCRHINGHLKLIRAGTMDATGHWDVMPNPDKNSYWTWTTRELQVITTVTGSSNWSTDKRVALQSEQVLTTSSRVRMNVRSATGECLETVTFTPGAARLTGGFWNKDFAAQINRTSLYVRAGKQVGESIVPEASAKQNWIWLPHNGDLSVTWTVDKTTEACKLLADRDALEGERISFFAFDDKADKLLDRITLTASKAKNSLGKAQWPAELAKQINASSGHASATATAISQKYAELRLFTTALHLDNWAQGTTIAATAALTAADRIVVKVATTTKGNFCEAVTFTPNPARLAATQWAKDLATYINGHSLYLKAGVKDTTKKTIDPAEHASNNVIWLPKDAKLTVTFEKTQLRELAPVSLQHDLAVGEKSYVYVMDDKTDVILREITYTPTAGHAERYSEAHDFAAAIDKATELVIAGHKVGDAVPVPAWSSYQNKIWGCASTVRAFHTLHSLGNWDQGDVIGDHDLVENEQVVVNVSGKNSGRILETLSFIPEPERMSQTLWPKDFAGMVNKTSKFIRAGRENSTDDKIEPWHAKDANTFWTPKGSGLEVEMRTLSGIPWPLPGMSHEARELFEQCVEAKKYITIDAQHGLAVLNIPLVDLFADDSFKDPLGLGISYSKEEGIAIQLGHMKRSVKTVGGLGSGEYAIPLRDGRAIQVNLNQSSINGGDFVVKGTFEELVVDGFPIPPARLVGYSVTYKDGLRESYRIEMFNEFNAFVRLSKYELPSAGTLDFKYNKEGELSKVLNGSQVLVEVEWFEMADVVGVGGLPDALPSAITIFPNDSSDKKIVTFSDPIATAHQTPLQIMFEMDGFAKTGKTSCTIKKDDVDRLVSVEFSYQQTFTVDKKQLTEEARYGEFLEYVNDKVSRHIICPGEGIDDLVQEYVYSDTSTTLTGYFKSASPRSTFVRQFDFRDQHSLVESHGSGAVPYSKRRSQRLDTTEKRAITETCIWEGDVPVDRQTLSVDAVGNPVERINNDEITRWTYYNNYQQFTVTETEVRVQDWSFFACLFMPVDYTGLIGASFAIGGKGGLTWGTRIDTTVDMTPALNEYAKTAFNLPVKITHCGSDRPLSGEAESELVSRRIGDKEVPQRLTFYGYDEVAGQIRAKQKLTILHPDCTEVDVTAEQYKVAETAAKPFVESLKKQIADSEGETRKAFEKTLKDLTYSLKAQSEANAKGFKLNSWKLASMTLEAFEYHTEKDKPGYGTVKSIETVQIDYTGELIESSRVKKAFAYTVDAADANKVTITTTVSRKGDISITSSQTRSRLTGRLLGSTDTEGNVTVRTYDPQGNLTSETVTDSGGATRNTTCTLVRGLLWQHDMVQDGITTRIERDVLGRKVAEAVKPDGKFLETRRWTYDLLGRIASCVETDYGAGDAKIAIRESNRVYDELTGEVIITNLLKDGAGQTVKKIFQNQTPLLRGERFKQSAFTVERQYNPNKRIMTELYSYTGMDSGKIERTMSPEGLTKSVRYLTIDDKNTETEQDKQDFEYDGYGQLTKVTPKFGAATTYTYDSAGRLCSSTRDGVHFKNAYQPTTLAPVAAESSVKSGDYVYELGKQDVDLLGRALNQTVASRKTEFKYSGASTRAVLKTAVSGPPALAGYESSHDKKTRTLTQKLGTKSSTVVFSTGGRVVSFTDLTGAKTTYEYDFSNRLTKSSSDHCICTWSYHGNGLLGQETITAVKEKNLTMTVKYTYDGLGQEIRRTFDCPGIDRLQLDRTLLGDGRLKKSVLKAADKEKYTDSYEYDNALRLSKWHESERPSRQTRWSTWAYDALGNVTKRTDPVTNVAKTFKYDETKKEQLRKDHNFPANGSEPSDDGISEWEYDDAGRTISDSHGYSYSYHENGQINAFDLFIFSYDKEGRVRGGVIGDLTYTYHYCGDRVYALEVSNSDTNASPTQRSHVLRNESPSCLMQDTDRDGVASRSFELRDASGTVFASVDLATKTITYFRYGPYGERYEGKHENNWLGFKGEPFNMFGMYHLGNGYRLYDPMLGRFMTRDSKAPFSVGGAAGYVFCNGDPVNYKDPSGHEVVAEYSRWGAVPAIQSTAFRIVIGAVGVLLAPFTAGTSVLLAVATTALAAISFAFDVASIIVSQSDPELAKTLEAWGQAFAIAGAAAGVAMTVHGWKGIPRNWFRPRGGPSSRAPVKPLGSATRQLSAGTQRAMKELTDMMVQDAKAAGKTRLLNASYMDADPSMLGAGVAPGLNLDRRFHHRAGNATKNLFKGTVGQFDDSLLDFLGHILDLHTGPNTLVQKFVPPMASETEIKSLVALPLPGLEELFK